MLHSFLTNIRQLKAGLVSQKIGGKQIENYCRNITTCTLNYSGLEVYHQSFTNVSDQICLAFLSYTGLRKLWRK